MPLITAAQARHPRRRRPAGLQPGLPRGPHPPCPGHGRLACDLDEIEARSLAQLKYYGRDRSYWANVDEAAAILGVTRSRVRQMLVEDRLPNVTAPNGRRYMRRRQLGVVANARDQRNSSRTR